jgi:Secretion system C-terminal sorting domain
MALYSNLKENYIALGFISNFMKSIVKILLILILFGIEIPAQNAADYFPQMGYKWLYRVVPLDSLNNELSGSEFFRADSFASISNYKGRNANIVFSKTGPEITLPVQPYTDSLFFSPESSVMFEYSQVGTLATFLSQLDSVLNDTTFSFLNFLRSLEDWYSVYRFNQSVNSQYTIYTVDTTISIQSQTVPLRFKYLGKRLNDEIIQTQIGSFDCKKFIVTRGVSYLILLPPPIPPIEVPILISDDSLWIAPGNWIVKSFAPTTNVDLSLLGFGAFYIPGLKMDIQSQLVSVENEKNIPDEFVLYQNYPNPFNPSTNINFQLKVAGHTKLEIFDVLGNKITSIVNEYLKPGFYTYTFNSSNLSSGIYLYKLSSGNRVISKKMTFLK